MIACSIIAVAFVGCGDKSTNTSKADFLADAVELAANYAKALNDGDAEAYAALLDVNFHQMPPDGPIVDGREAVYTNTKGLLAAVDFKDFTIIDTRHEMVGDYGFLWGTTPLVYTPFSGKHLSIMTRQSDGTLVFYADCWNSNDP
jgi:ketosteroid isomerase-like protein